MHESDYKKLLHDTLDFSIYIAKNILPESLSINGDGDLYLRKLFSSTLLIRSLNKSYAINQLLKEDLYEEAEIILRSLIEITFTIKAIAVDQSFIEDYINNMNRQKLKSLKSFQKGKDLLRDFVPIPKNLNTQIKELEKFNEKNGFKKDLSIYQTAKRANLLPIYHSVYATICSSVHSGADDMKSYLKDYMNPAQKVIKRPEKNNYDLIQFSAIESMSHILHSIETIYSISNEKIIELDKVYQMLNSIMHDKYILGKDIFSKD